MATATEQDQINLGDVLEQFEELILVESDFLTMVTPELATALLKGNSRNRSLPRKRVETLVGAIERGEWKYNGSPVCMTEDGRLVDGQTRLTACVKSGATLPMLIAVVDDEVQDTIDQIRPRTFAHFLQMKGIKDADAMATMTMLLWGYAKDGVPSGQGRGGATIAERWKLLREHPEAMPILADAKTTHFTPRPFVAAFRYLVGRGPDADRAEEFIDLVKTGEGLEPGDPILALRNKITAARSKPGVSISSKLRAYYWVTTWNRWLTGQTKLALIFDPGEKIPDIKGLDWREFGDA